MTHNRAAALTVKMFVRTVMQMRVVTDMVELTNMQLPERDLPGQFLAEKLNEKIGGKCHEDVYVRKGKQYFEIQRFSLPETEGADMSITVQFLCDTFVPKKPGVVFEMKVDQVFAVALADCPMLECSWPDPETGEVAMRAYVLAATAAGTASATVGRVVSVAIGEVKAEVGETHLKAMGKLVVASNV